MKKEGNVRLFSEFPGITTAAWVEKINSDLKGNEFPKKLIWNTEEGIDVKPFYRNEDNASLGYLASVSNMRNSGNAPNEWIICQDVFPGNNILDSNKRIRAALKGGAQAIRIYLTDFPQPSSEILQSLLNGVHLGETELLFKGSIDADLLYSRLCELAKSSGVDPFNLKGSLGADPFGKMAATGAPVSSLESIGKLLKRVNFHSPEMRVVEIDGGLMHNSGSTLVQELGLSMAIASEYMALLTGQGIDPAKIASSMRLNLAVGSNYFMEIAKLRAARILWARIGQAYGINLSTGEIRIHSTSSEWNLTLYDPYINMVRGTTEAMSSVLGGADMVSVLPYDYSYGRSTVFSDRIARNVQLILREETYLDRVTDPASGSYYIENLTDSVGEKSWELFREVELKGGFRKAFISGFIQDKIVASRRRKIERLASGETRILGTNAFPDFNEMILEKLKESGSVEQDGMESPGTETGSGKTAGTQFQSLKPLRVSSIFEEVRIETEKSSLRPRVLLCKFGNQAWSTARASFSGNFFACAGYEILDHPAFSTLEACKRAAIENKADIVVLCSSDNEYSEIAPDIIQALKELSIVVVAGYPASSINALRLAGVDHFIHVKSNLLETLKEFNKTLL